MDKWKKLENMALTACGGKLEHPARYPYRDYNGRRYYFCNEDCLQEFEKDPDDFLAGHVPHPIGEES